MTFSTSGTHIQNCYLKFETFQIHIVSTPPPPPPTHTHKGWGGGGAMKKWGKVSLVMEEVCERSMYGTQTNHTSSANYAGCSC